MKGFDTFRNIVSAHRIIWGKIWGDLKDRLLFFPGFTICKTSLQSFTHPNLLIHPETEPAPAALIGTLKAAQLHALPILCLKKQNQDFFFYSSLKITGLAAPEIITKVQLVMFSS